MKKRMNGTTSSSNNAGFKRVMLTLVVLLLSATLMVGAVSAADPVPVYTESDLTSNLSDTDVTEIKLMGDIVIEKPLFINHSVKIDGNHKFITADNESGNFVHTGSHSDGKNCYHLLCIINTSANLDIAIKNVTFDNDGDAYGLHFWSNKKDVKQNLTLENVWIIDSQGSGLTMRGVNVSATGLTIENSGWGQSIDIQSVSTFTSLLQIDTLNGLKDGVKISDEGVGYPGQVYVNGDKTSHDFVLYPGNTAKRFVWASSQEAVYPGKYVALVGVDNSVPLLLYADLTNATSSSDAKNVTLLRDVVLDEPLTIDQAITFDGNQKTLTLNHGAGMTAITASAAVTLENFTIVASKDAAFGTAINLNGDGSILQNNVIDLSTLNTKGTNGVTKWSSIAVLVSEDKVTITDNVIKAGNSETSSSQCVVVVSASGATDVKIKDNELVAGEASGDDNSNPNDKTSSGSIGVRISKNAAVTIANNSITSTAKDATRQAAIAIDGSATSGASVTATNNTIELSTNTMTGDVGDYGVVLYVDTGANAKVTAKLEDNEIVSSTYVIYADNAELSSGTTTPVDVTINGEIYNNWFGDIKTVVANHTDINLKTESLQWYTTPAAIGAHKTWTNGQTHIAGNWWTLYSGSQPGTATGYQTLDAETAKLKLGVADLYPLVKVDANAAKTILIAGTTSINSTDTTAVAEVYNLTAKYSDGTTTDFKWTVTGDYGILKFQKGESDTTEVSNTSLVGSTIYYKVESGAAGSVTFTVTDEKATGEIIVTAVKPTVPEADVTLIEVDDDSVTISGITNGITNAEGKTLVAGDKTTTAVISAGEGVQIQLTYATEATVGQNGQSITGDNPEVEAQYLPTTSAVAPEFPFTVTSSLNVNLISEKVAVDGATDIALPSRTTEYDESVAQKVEATGLYRPISVDTAGVAADGTPLSTFNLNIGKDGIYAEYTIDGKVTDKLVILHVGNKVDALATTQTYDATTGKTIVTASSDMKFSSYVLAYDDRQEQVTTPTGDSSSTGTSEWLTETPTQQPTDKPTDKPTDTVPTDVPTTSKPTEEPSSPGFGILAALAGLGAVAVLRRK